MTGNKMSENVSYGYLDELKIDGKSRKLDDIQKKVCCNTKNAVAAAGAGSGKTQVLATRFAWLVISKKVDVSKILTLTFTKKAAGEMYERIYKTLQFFAYEAKSVTDGERELAKKALDNFSRCHIQTLDSYCSALVKQAASSYGIKPDFAAGAGDAAKNIRDAAFPFIMANSVSRISIRHYSELGKIPEFATKTFSKIIEKYSTIANDGNFFRKKFATQLEIIKNIWNFLVCGQGEVRPDYLPDEMFPLEDSLRDFIEFESVIKASTGMFVKIQAVKEKMEAVDWSAIPRIDSIEQISSGEFLQKAESFFAVFDKLAQEVKSVSLVGQRNDDLKNAVYSLKGKKGECLGLFEILVPLKNYFIMCEYKYAADFMDLLDEFSAMQNEKKRRSGNLTFADVSSLALKILKENKKIRSQEKSAYSKIMIDEFQDNNNDNKNLLFLLSEKFFPEYANDGNFGCKDGIPQACDLDPDKLFFVGDEKQSIYKFRGADVSTFNNLKEDFMETRLPPMVYNYRSDNELISAFNVFFGNPIAFLTGENLPEYEASYSSPAQAYKVQVTDDGQIEGAPLPQVAITGENARIHCAMLNKFLLKNLDDGEKTEKSDDPPQAKDIVYSYVARQILEIRKKCFSTGEKFNFSSIAILDKSRTNRKYMAKWLNAYGIPFDLDQNSELFSDGPINDIYNILRLCVYPDDKIAYASFLASPFAGLSVEEVENILAGGQFGTEKVKFDAACSFLDEIRESAFSKDLASTISDLWYGRGYYFETMMNKKARQQAEAFDLLFEIARQADENGKSLPWFVDQLALLKAEEETSFSGKDVDMDAKEVSFPLEKEDAVQIMTIHKSKGLQFDYVFVLGCTEVHAKGNRENFLFDKFSGLSLKNPETNENLFKILHKDLSEKQDLAEFRRLLYVALTRAIHEVYICGLWNVNLDDEKKGGEDSDFHVVEKLVKEYYVDSLTAPDFAMQPDGELDFTFVEGAPFDYLSLKTTPYQAEEKDDISKKVFQKMENLFLPGNHMSVEELEGQYSRLTPSSLENSQVAIVSLSEAEKKAGEKFSGIEKLLEKYKSPAESDVSEGLDSFEKSGESQNPDTEDESFDSNVFDAGAFGTLVHSCLEATVKGINLGDFNIPLSAYKNVESTEDRRQIKDFCNQMAEIFFSSDEGKALLACKNAGGFVKAEWAFKTEILFPASAGGQEVKAGLYTGSIDLIYQNPDGTYSIVDYKSDLNVKPEKYYGQQYVYRLAAARLLGLSDEEAAEKIKCRLFFLRYGKSVLCGF